MNLRQSSTTWSVLQLPTSALALPVTASKLAVVCVKILLHRRGYAMGARSAVLLSSSASKSNTESDLAESEDDGKGIHS